MAFPSTLSSFNRPNSTDRLNNPSHSALHNTVSSALGQVEAVIGVDGASSVVGTMMYDLRSPASGGGGHVQWANKGGTGQTSYTKGDILVAQSSSVLTKLAVGADGTFLSANSNGATGVTWGTVTSVVGIPTVKITTVSSVWTKPSLMTYAVIEVVGSGGGGNAGGANTYAGGGGGGGGYARKIFTASTLGSTQTITVGVGGTAGTGSNGGPTAGGTVGIGVPSILYATGGSGAGGGNGGALHAGGSGGMGFLGDLNVKGGGGGKSGESGVVYALNGGNSFFGGGGKGSNTTGEDGGAYGGGASGGGGNGTNGGAGAVGAVIITEYYI